MAPRLFRAAAVVVVAFVACDSPFEPQGLGERVPIGLEVTDEVSGDTVARYSFVSPADSPFVVFLQALEGTVQLVVVDSTSQYSIASLSAGPNSPALYQNPTSTFPTEQGDVYQLRVYAIPVAAAHARFRFVIYPINTSPELQSDRFAFGDTVVGETIDPMVEMDQFLAHGDSGQEIVAVGETPGSAGSGSVALDVMRYCDIPPEPTPEPNPLTVVLNATAFFEVANP